MVRGSVTARQWLISLGLPLVTLFSVAVAKLRFGIPSRLLMGDPAALSSLPRWAGVVSNLGILAWAAAASIATFAAFVTRHEGAGSHFSFLISSSLFTAYLLLDDSLMIHEGLAARTGMDEAVLFALLGVVLIAYVLVFRELIAASRWQMLLAAVLLLAGSVVVDLVAVPFLVGRVLGWGMAEDGMKLLGIAAWLSYLVNTSYRLVLDALPSRPSGP